MGEYKNDIDSFTSEINDLRKLKILVETVNDIILQYHYTISKSIKIVNPKNVNSTIYLRPYLIIKQDKDVENVNNLIENIQNLKNLYKMKSKNYYNNLSEELYYKDISTYTIDNESIGGEENDSLFENFIILLDETVKIIYDEDYYNYRCMTTLNESTDLPKIKNTFKNYIFVKYPLFSKIFYDIKNYYLDLGIIYFALKALILIYLNR
ncbi:hypothetical protein BCR36DRAFT_368932 [Piromyces finnis]|uniref:Uncharacterized protein n=1 Tax=Piromyces finnis TaxID=1754191 RepID=A0A1Y1VCY6_9FUNG|nr:hypothetical protein BCR36DRAFT_368932 [Piromyces finnis]|eukprot:ORX53270.1 hypothetical protein BCR36DRAFT_368932 [Piromyces finnis]